MEFAGSPGLLVTKLHPPVGRDQTVPRDRLLERLQPSAGIRLTAVIAPAGCGKTTLLGMWRDAEAPLRPVAWVTLDEHDDDPVVLWSHVVEALRRVRPAVGASISPALVRTGGLVEVVLPRLVNVLAEQGDVVLILDDFHRLSSGPAREGLAWLVDHAPSTFHPVISSRTEPALPLATLRAHGELVELRADELGFTFDEADALLNGHLGLGLAREDVHDLIERTEGWASGLYLAALSLGGVPDRHDFVNTFSGAHRHVVDYLVGQVLDAHDPAMQTLMVRSSILERLSGPLCDAVLEQVGSGDLLGALSDTNLFLIPLDDRGEWYRFHQLFAQLLRVELEHREPGVAPALHHRAYVWFRDRGFVEEAIEHAMDAGAFADVGELIAANWNPFIQAAARHRTVLGWFQRLPRDVLGGDSRLRLAYAWTLSLCGMRDEAMQAAAAVEQLGGLDEGPLPDGFGSLEASLATLRAANTPGDVGARLVDAFRAADLEGTHSPWRPVISSLVATGLYFRGQSDEADRWFMEAADLAQRTEHWLTAAMSLAYRSLIAGEREQRGEQMLLAEQAMNLAHDRGIGDFDGAALIALGVSLALRDRAEEALPLLDRGVAAARSLRQPLHLAQALISQAAVLRLLGERERATAAVAEARRTVDSCPDPGILRDRVEALERSLKTRLRRPEMELSDRELAVLRLLSGPLSEREVARELYLSHNTVHSHTKSIYHKLGVSSRAEALDRARKLGLFRTRGDSPR